AMAQMLAEHLWNRGRRAALLLEDREREALHEDDRSVILALAPGPLEPRAEPARKMPVRVRVELGVELGERREPRPERTLTGGDHPVRATGKDELASRMGSDDILVRVADDRAHICASPRPDDDQARLVVGIRLKVDDEAAWAEDPMDRSEGIDHARPCDSSPRPAAEGDGEPAETGKP